MIGTSCDVRKKKMLNGELAKSFDCRIDKARMVSLNGGNRSGREFTIERENFTK